MQWRVDWRRRGASVGALPSLPVTVVGAGPAGLAVAAELMRRHVPVEVLERGAHIGESWRSRYDRLHLHTPRSRSQLPGLRLSGPGRWASRDEVVRYLESYAERFGIRVHTGVDVRRIDERADGAGWVLTTAQGQRPAAVVVLATGYNHTPYTPSWPDRDAFPGVVVHAGEYRSPDAYRGRDVVVVGTGNSGAEIAADLAENGAGRVRLAVRTPPQVVPRTVAGVPVSLVGLVEEAVPPWLGDPVNRLLQRLTIGDLRRYGMPAPSEGLIAQHRRRDTVPIIDVGLVAQLRARRVEPVAAVADVDAEGVLLADGGRVTCDAVIAATGYRTGLEGLIGHLGVLDGRGRPVADPNGAVVGVDGLFAVGFRNPLSGALGAIRVDARRVARRATADLVGARITLPTRWVDPPRTSGRGRGRRRTRHGR